MVADPRPRLVLVVDDYPDAREMYAESLAGSGFAVAQAGSGEEAIEKTRALLPHAVVMDVSLPGIDGWSATRALKADPRTATIPVLAITGHARANARDTAREVGCDAFLIKPCLPDDVVSAVKRMLKSDSGTGAS